MAKDVPYDPNAEAAVVGAALVAPDVALPRIGDLQADDFLMPANREAWEAIVAAQARGVRIDVLTVGDIIRGRDSWGRFEGGWQAWAVAAANNVPQALNVEHYAAIVREKATLRRTIELCDETKLRAHGEDPAEVVLGEARQRFSELEIRGRQQGPIHIGQAISSAVTEIAGRSTAESRHLIPTYLSTLDDYLGGVAPEEVMVVAGRPGMGKCLGKGTKLLMFDGALKNVEDIVVGDLLMGDDSSPRTVLSLARGREMMYWVHQNHGISYRANGSHILSLKRSRAESGHAHGEVLNIELRTFIARSRKFQSNYKGYKSPVEFPKHPVPIAPYFLGLWLGDGHSSSSRITNTDPEIVEYMGEFAREIGGRLVKYDQVGKVSSYAITKGRRGGAPTWSLQTALRALGVLHNKHIPHNYLANSRDNRLALLAGLLDSDGHYNRVFHCYEITQKREHLARSIKLLCDTLGFKTSFRTKKASIKARNFAADVFRVRLSGNLSAIPVRVERKKARERISPCDPLHTGIRITPDKVDEYYGFEIDGNKLFLLEDATVTHNTAFADGMLMSAAADKWPCLFFSLEMSMQRLLERILSMRTGIPASHMRTGRNERGEPLDKAVHLRLLKEGGRLEGLPLLIDDRTLTLNQLVAEARRWHARTVAGSDQPMGLVAIDYLQLIGVDDARVDKTREQQVARMSRELKKLAKAIHSPVVLLAQLNREVEKRGGRPMLSDLRESGAIEQDADIIMFIHREGMMGEDQKARNADGPAEVIVAKNRGGAIGIAPAQWLARTMEFVAGDTRHAGYEGPDTKPETEPHWSDGPGGREPQ